MQTKTGKEQKISKLLLLLKIIIRNYENNRYRPITC